MIVLARKDHRFERSRPVRAMGGLPKGGAEAEQQYAQKCSMSHSDHFPFTSDAPAPLIPKRLPSPNPISKLGSLGGGDCPNCLPLSNRLTHSQIVGDVA